MSHTVLIVDDSLTVRMDLDEAFRAGGFRTMLAGTLAEARERMAGGPADVIVLDVLLPDGSGVDLLQEIRARPEGATAAVLMLSSEAEIGDRVRGLKNGADEYIGKPYDAGYLVARVEDLVRSRARREATTVLLVDDSPTFRHALCEALVGSGYAVVEAASGEEGLRVAGSRRPDAVVVDGMLPGIDGATVIRHLRLDAALRDVPCLLLTGSGADRAGLLALDAGADGFVRKEEDLEVILARLAAVLRRSPAPSPGMAGTTSLSRLRKILAIGRDEEFFRSAVGALKEDGYDAILARSGEEALELLAVQPVDCILLDRQLPGLSGQEMCERIKSAPGVRDIPLIMLSASDDREAMIKGLGGGADDFLSKRSGLDVLEARIRAQIRRKQVQDETRRVRDEMLRWELEAAGARAARELAETRAALVSELERRNRELEAFSYSVSHDLRAPLRAIDGFSRMVLEDFGNALDAKGRGHLQRVCAAAKRMGELIDDLLELSRVSRADLRRSPVDLSRLARQIVAELKKRADRPVRVAIEDGLHADADHRLIAIALENLLGNSWKFTANAPEASITFGCDASGGGGHAVFYVRDNGAGFDMAYVDKLFRPFQRLHSDRDFSGTGIGLATVQRIVDRHGGRVWAEGAIGQGATFFFTIPPARHRDWL